MNSSKSKKILVYLIMGLLSLAGIYSEIVACIYGNSLSLVAETIVTCVMFVLIAYYAVANFRVPHGNLLKYLFLAFSAMAFVGILYIVPDGALNGGKLLLYQVLRGITIISSAYVAGRLDRIRQNTALIIISAICLLISAIQSIVVGKVTNFIAILFLSNFFILWLDLMIAYLFRYRSHKDAGLADK